MDNNRYIVAGGNNGGRIFDPKTGKMQRPEKWSESAFFTVRCPNIRQNGNRLEDNNSMEMFRRKFHLNGSLSQILFSYPSNDWKNLKIMTCRGRKLDANQTFVEQNISPDSSLWIQSCEIGDRKPVLSHTSDFDRDVHLYPVRNHSLTAGGWQQEGPVAMDLNEDWLPEIKEAVGNLNLEENTNESWTEIVFERFPGLKNAHTKYRQMISKTSVNFNETNVFENLSDAERKIFSMMPGFQCDAKCIYLYSSTIVSKKLNIQICNDVDEVGGRLRFLIYGILQYIDRPLGDRFENDIKLTSWQLYKGASLNTEQSKRFVLGEYYLIPMFISTTTDFSISLEYGSLAHQKYAAEIKRKKGKPLAPSTKIPTLIYLNVSNDCLGRQLEDNVQMYPRNVETLLPPLTVMKLVSTRNETQMLGKKKQRKTPGTLQCFEFDVLSPGQLRELERRPITCNPMVVYF